MLLRVHIAFHIHLDTQGIARLVEKNVPLPIFASRGDATATVEVASLLMGGRIAFCIHFYQANEPLCVKMDVKRDR